MSIFDKINRIGAKAEAAKSETEEKRLKPRRELESLRADAQKQSEAFELLAANGDYKALSAIKFEMYLKILKSKDVLVGFALIEKELAETQQAVDQISVFEKDGLGDDPELQEVKSELTERLRKYVQEIANGFKKLSKLYDIQLKEFGDETGLITSPEVSEKTWETQTSDAKEKFFQSFIQKAWAHKFPYNHTFDHDDKTLIEKYVKDNKEKSYLLGQSFDETASLIGSEISNEDLREKLLRRIVAGDLSSLNEKERITNEELLQIPASVKASINELLLRYKVFSMRTQDEMRGHIRSKIEMNSVLVGADPEKTQGFHRGVTVQDGEFSFRDYDVASEDGEPKEGYAKDAKAFIFKWIENPQERQYRFEEICKKYGIRDRVRDEIDAFFAIQKGVSVDDIPDKNVRKVADDILLHTSSLEDFLNKLNFRANALDFKEKPLKIQSVNQAQIAIDAIHARVANALSKAEANAEYLRNRGEERVREVVQEKDSALSEKDRAIRKMEDDLRNKESKEQELKNKIQYSEQKINEVSGAEQQVRQALASTQQNLEKISARERLATEKVEKLKRIVENAKTKDVGMFNAKSTLEALLATLSAELGS